MAYSRSRRVGGARRTSRTSYRRPARRSPVRRAGVRSATRPQTVKIVIQQAPAASDPFTKPADPNRRSRF